ncbi:MAG TPA: hypothetical protein VEF76_03095 [Patescibacteria group bacterium]|nr:hypothetical protein [Patescibacteria group bacterium]
MRLRLVAAAIAFNALTLPLSPASAQEAAGTEKGDVALLVSGASYHVGQRTYRDENGQSRKWNEFNPGLGLEVQLSRHFYLAAGGYKNSIHKPSLYAGIGAETDSRRRWGLGVQAGLITGYEIPVVPSAIPYLRIGRQDKANVKINVIPPIKGLTPAVAAVQLRIPIG